VTRAHELVIDPPRLAGDRCVWSARLDDGGPETEVRFAIAAEHRQALTLRGDPFVLAVLYRLMRRGGTLRVRGAPLSPSLLDRLEGFQAAWCLWRTLERVDLRGEEEREDGRRPAAALCFSGGVDSAFSAWRHVKAPPGRWRRELAAGVMVHGYDIPLDDVPGFAGAAARSQRLLESLGLGLITVATNLRDLEPDWEASHGLAMAAALTLLGGEFGAGLIAASDTYALTVPDWGSNPITDWMTGGESFEIVHDGAEFTRFQKIRALGGWPQALADLRYCWVGEPRDRNCGRCRKCAWTQLMFRAAGLDPACVDVRMSDEELSAALREWRPGPFVARMLPEVWEAVRAEGRSEGWVGALGEAVAALQAGR
jgi:hypothetical protein